MIYSARIKNVIELVFKMFDLFKIMQEINLKISGYTDFFSKIFSVRKIIKCIYYFILILLILIHQKVNANGDRFIKYLNRLSLINVITNPVEYNNKKIVVTGYFKINTRTPRLYVIKDFAEYNINENSIKIFFDKKFTFRIDGKNKKLKDFNSKYVIVSGTFNSSKMTLCKCTDIFE